VNSLDPVAMKEAPELLERKKVLVITGDPIGVKLAGPAIRAWNIAQALADLQDVVLMSLTRVEDIPAPFRLVQVDAGHDRGFAQWERWADIIIFQGHAMESFDGLSGTKKIVVADIYDPMHLEQLEQSKSLSLVEWNSRVEEATLSLNQQLLRADFFICASERQRYFYLGQLSALGRLNPSNYAADPDLNRLISVVPFGLNRQLPAHNRAVLKGILKGIAETDKVLLWGGGLYDWFDPKTLITAVSQLSLRRPSVRLFFQGTQHPHPGVPEMAVVRESRELARSLGVLGSAVHFNGSWVDYADRHNYLIEAGVSTHFSHMETAMSFRTRILDYLWAGLPMVVTEGDVFAELIERENLGIVVPAQDTDALADALERILYDKEFITEARENIVRIRERFYWDVVLRPLVTFVAAAHRAPDSNGLFGRPPRGRRAYSPMRVRGRRGVRFAVSRIHFHLRTSGLRVVLQKIHDRLK
jgi:glycosyltransferase involved in cell wall biosynthesis